MLASAARAMASTCPTEAQRLNSLSRSRRELDQGARHPSLPLEPTPTRPVPPQPEILQPEPRRPGSRTEKAGSGHQQGLNGALPRYLLMRSTARRDWAIMPLERGT